MSEPAPSERFRPCMCGVLRVERNPNCPEHTRSDALYSAGGVVVAFWSGLTDLQRAVAWHQSACAFAGEELPLQPLYDRFGQEAVTHQLSAFNREP